MKNLILVALILQLVITVIDSKDEPEYHFGDIIAFPRWSETKPLLKHYAIYVGPEQCVNVSQGDNDIFHYPGLPKKNCAFGKLSKTKRHSEPRVENYLDDIDGFTLGSTKKIKQRILEANENCTKYKLFTNNCEHLATWVRYNEAHSIQSGTIIEKLFSILNKSKDEKAKEILEKLKNENSECEFPAG